MAPFSICSQCKARTRKVVRDPITFKEIYLCPKCSKAKNDMHNIENEQSNKELRATNQDSPALDLKKLPPEAKQAMPQKLPLAAAATATRCNLSRKCTPPIMQPVVINGRKYIAISATASDN